MEENEKTKSIEKEVIQKLTEFDKKIHEFIIKPVSNKLVYTYTSDESYMKIEDVRRKLNSYISHYTRIGFDIKIIGELADFLKVELPEALRSIEKIVYSSFPTGRDRSLVKMNIAARFDDIKEIITIAQELKDIKYPYEARQEKSYQESVYDMLTSGGIPGDNKEEISNRTLNTIISY